MTIEKRESPKSDVLRDAEDCSDPVATSSSNLSNQELAEKKSSRFRPLIGLAEQAFLAMIVALCLCALGGYYWTTHVRRGPWIEIEQAPARPIQFRVDINRADWTELAILPGVGESLAQRIIEDRETNGLYASADQLTRVRGIGEKKLEAIREFLLPLEESRSEEIAATKNK